MVVKIVTDSTADIPPDLAKDLSITVVPLYVRFGRETYLDRVQIREEEFYRRLQSDPVHPNTSQPTPQDFANVYRELSQQADGIISIHISGKLSGTYNSALQAKVMTPMGFPLEVVDSKSVSMGLGMLAIKAATLANSGKDLQQVMEAVKQSNDSLHLLILFDTLKYLALGGRIGKAKALLGTLLSVKPLLGMKDGELIPVSQPRTRAKGLELLYDFVSKLSDIQDLSIMYSTTLDEAQLLGDRIDAVYDRNRIKYARIGPALGVHTGPGTLAIAAVAHRMG